MRSERGFLKGLNPTVAIVSKSLVVIFVLFGVFFTDTAALLFTQLRDGITANVSWFYIAVVSAALLACFWLMLSRFGHVKLGKPDDTPDFSYFSWFSMLFAAGMGIGLIFWSIAEPISHFQGNPFTENIEDAEAAQVAMRITFMHWGLHPWAIYTLVGLVFAYFAYCRDLPLTVRSALFPLIGERIYGWMGHTVDILAIFATTFGVATSLGLGAAQINTGLQQLFGIAISLQNQVIIICAITAVAVTSVASGLNRGIRLLSEMNFWFSLVLLAFVLSLGPTAYLIEDFVQSLGDYVQNIVWMSVWTEGNENSGWQASWTTFYWGWWISWAPFVGMFIARISRGRTIREFVVGVLLVPTCLTMMWLVVMGGTALNIELNGPGGIVEATNEDATLALYATLAQLDSGWLGSVVAAFATLLIATYFITSSDSGTLVVNTILSVGHHTPPLEHRIIWGVSEGAVAATLLLTGGLTALQSAAISAALPFAVIMIIMTAGLFVALHEDFPALPKKTEHR